MPRPVRRPRRPAPRRVAARHRGEVSSFALAVLPDTQFYSRYATTDENLQFQRKYGSAPFLAQTKWITRQRRRPAHPVHDPPRRRGGSTGKPLQWQIADEAMEVMRSGPRAVLDPGPATTT